MPDTHHFGPGPVTCHAWSGDRTQLAIATSSHEVYIYRYTGGKWVKEDTLNEHGQQVTGIDWAPNCNRIVTCSADRNAYVWTPQASGKWKATMVILRVNRAATCVKWSPNEDKFAVGSGARIISVCYFDPEPDWWVSKHIKKPMRSTITCLDWHPNSVLLAAGSSDFRTRVFSAYIKEVESKPSPTNWGSKMPFGNLMAEYSNGGGGWVHSVSFSGNGDRLVWVGHDSSVSVVDAARGMIMSTLKTNFLPFMACMWISDSCIVAGGHDCGPIMFQYNDSASSITFTHKLDQSEVQQPSSKFSAMREFQALDRRGQTAEENTTVLGTIHQNTIMQISIYSGTKSSCNIFTTTGVDGKLVNWDLRSLESSVAGLRLH